MSVILTHGKVPTFTKEQKKIRRIANRTHSRVRELYKAAPVVTVYAKAA